MKLVELKPTGKQKSFYRKAFVVIEEDPETFTERYHLFSYETELCSVERSSLFNVKTIKLKACQENLSSTSRRHFKAFLRTYYFN